MRSLVQRRLPGVLVGNRRLRARGRAPQTAAAFPRLDAGVATARRLWPAARTPGAQAVPARRAGSHRQRLQRGARDLVTDTRDAADGAGVLLAAAARGV